MIPSPPFPARFGLLGDVHADYEALETALEWLSEQDVPDVLCTGDIVNGVGDADACCTLLRTRSIPTVRGKHDRWFINGQMMGLPDATPLESICCENLDWLRELPATLDFLWGDAEIMLCHGLKANDMAGVRSGDYGYSLEVNEPLQSLINDDRYRYVLCGHTHESLVRAFNSLTILNPGALYRRHGGTFAIMEFEARQMTLFSLQKSLEICEQFVWTF